ncbi:YncE family protein [Cellulomonas sp. P5_C5]
MARLAPARVRAWLVRSPRAWSGAAMASVVALPLVLVAALGQGNDVRELAQSSGSAWVASPERGIVSLIDGPADLVATTVRVNAAAAVDVEQSGASAFVVDDAAGTVTRVDGATWTVTPPFAFGAANGSLSVLQGVDHVYVLDSTRRTATVVDPVTLARHEVVSLDAQPGPEQAVVDDAGRLWVVDAERGGLTWYDGTHHVARDRADADDRLVLVQGRPVLVSQSERSLVSLTDGGGVDARSCLEVRADDAVELLGSTDRDEVYAAIAETGTLVIARVGKDDCGRVVSVVAPGTEVAFGPLAQSGRFVFVPNEATGQTVVIDTDDDTVAGTFDLAPAGNRVELIGEDRLVFFNDLDGHEAGVLRFDGATWVKGESLSKYDPSDGTITEVLTPPADGPTGSGPVVGSAADAGPPPTGPTQPVPPVEPTSAPPEPTSEPEAAPDDPSDDPPDDAPDPSTRTDPTGAPDPRTTPAPTSPPTTTATIDVTVGGDGQVTSSPAGIDCPGTCTATFDTGTSVTLTARPGESSTLLGWSRACAAAMAANGCVLEVTGDLEVGAAFADAPERVPVTLTVVGGGSVESEPAGLSCDAAASPCSADFAAGSAVTLTGQADAESSEVAWSGACAGTGPCELLVAPGLSVTATFTDFATLQVAEPDGGRITGEGIDCPGDCEERLPVGSGLTLTARQFEDMQFTGWAGDCGGTSRTCDLVIDADPAAAASYVSYPIGVFTGSWSQSDGGGDEQVIVDASGSTSGTMHYYGDCTPTNCDWGTAPASMSGGTLTATWDHGYAVHTVTLTRSGANMHVTVIGDFTVEDGREDYVVERVFSRDAPPPPEVISW